ncbi:MAG TPA: O-antigen ligase family protein [Terriglobia bacterium]|nr:O-antigen ligase family protein [Terriglobia bacterium]
MGVDLAKPLELKRGAGRPVPRNQFAKPRRGISVNALVGMGLWILLWAGYNTDIGRVMKPTFPANTIDFIHGVRAFFPMLAGWFALLMIFVRSNRLAYWIMGPLGLMIVYAATGLVSSVTVSIDSIDALYYGANYLAIVLVLLAIVPVERPLPDLLNVLRLTWILGTILTLVLLGAIPLLGSQVMIQTEASPVGVRAYSGLGAVMGMASTRNTGFARYAAISALAALPMFMRKGKMAVRIFWGILLAASLYALVLANGRTEIVSFIAGLFVILGAEKTKRTLNFLLGIAAAILLAFRGFYSKFYLYFTRGARFDPTLTGRTQGWVKGWHLIWKSPWMGLGFQADRHYLGLHMHDAFLHALIQSGILGGVAIFIALGIVWYYTIRYFFRNQPSDRSLIPPEIPAIFLFVTLSSLTESTFAYYSAAWLLSAPIIAYVMALHQHMRKISLQASQERELRIRLARRKSRVLAPLPEVPPAAAGEGIG